jgi:hypothetical protein
MLRRSLSATALALLALAPAAYATVNQAPDITDTRYVSYIRQVLPDVPNVTWMVINRNDELDLTNHSDQTVTVYGYSGTLSERSFAGGPYARITANGTVQVNENSQAYYLNQSFYADYTALPAALIHNDTGYPTDWVTVAGNANFIWHDHRIHYTTFVDPPKSVVPDRHRTTLVQGWYVPIKVGATRGYVRGQLYWLAQNGSTFPIGALIALIVVIVAGAGFVVVVRRRRRANPPAEAW